MARWRALSLVGIVGLLSTPLTYCLHGFSPCETAEHKEGTRATHTVHQSVAELAVCSWDKLDNIIYVFNKSSENHFPICVQNVPNQKVVKQ